MYTLYSTCFISDMGTVFACAELGLCTVHVFKVHGAVIVLLLLPHATCMIDEFCRIDMRLRTAEVGYVRSLLL